MRDIQKHFVTGKARLDPRLSSVMCCEKANALFQLFAMNKAGPTRYLLED